MPFEIQDFCSHSVQVESCKISNVVDVQSFHLATAKVKYLGTWNFPPKCPPSTSSSWGKDFENELNTFRDMGFLLAQCTDWKWQNSKCCSWAKFSPSHFKSKTRAHLKLFAQMPTFNIFELRPRFRKSVECLWRYSIFLKQCTGWKWQTFKCGRCANLSPSHCKTKIPAHLKLSTQCRPSTSSSWGKDFENRLNIFRNIGFLLAQCTGWKLQNFKCCRCAKLSHYHCKSKIPAHLKLPNQMPTITIFEVMRRLRKSVEYLWSYSIGFFLAQCTGWKWPNFKCCSRTKFSPCHFNSKKRAHLKLSTQMPTLIMFELSQRFRKSCERLWRYWIFAGTIYRLKVAKLNFFRCAKFSPCHCTSKIPSHLKLSTRMPTLNIFELRQRLRKSVEYRRRCRIFDGAMYRLNVEKFQMLSMRKVFTLQF